MKTSVILFLLISYTFINIQAQTDIEIRKDSQVDKLVEKHIDFNKEKDGIYGYKVQIYFDSGNNSKRRAYDEKSRFLAKHSDVSAYLIFQEPNFKIRVGDFRTRMEAQGFLNKIIDDFEGAFIIIDKINLPDLDNENIEIEKE